MAGWIKMALGMEVALGPGHIVLDGDLPPLPKKGTESPNSGNFVFAKFVSTLVQCTFQKSKCVRQNVNVRPKLEGRELGDGSWGGSSEFPLYQLGVWVSTVRCPSRV